LKPDSRLNAHKKEKRGGKLTVPRGFPGRDLNLKLNRKIAILRRTRTLLGAGTEVLEDVNNRLFTKDVTTAEFKT
jgi:hypothetical protein